VLSLRIFVCIKVVPDPERASEITLDPQTKTVRREGIPLVINPMDKNALEAALQVRAQQGGEVTVVSMGPPSVEEVLRQSLALGADRVALLCDRCLAGADTLATARTLAAGIEKLGGADLVFCGAESADGGTAQVGPQVAALLGMAHAVYATAFSLRDGIAEVTVKTEDGEKVLQGGWPLLVTVSREINQPRGIRFSEIVKARKKPFNVFTAADLSLAETCIGEQGSPTRIAGIADAKMERRGEILEGEPEEAVAKLMTILRREGAI
jgi:electron transfer flavoprotein beta subunit